MSRVAASLIAILLSGGSLLAQQSPRAVLDKYCVTCHNERFRTGNLVLGREAVDPDHVAGAAAVWEKVLQKLRSGAMPPAGRQRPDAAAAAAFIAFTSQPVVASIQDDEVSYLALARLFASGTEPWARFYTTFPPLFPLLLAATGSAYDVARAHLVVALCAILALPLVYRYGAQALGRDDAAFALTAGFALLPATWLAAKPVLSEPAFLVLSLAALLFHERRMRAGGDARDVIIFALLLAAAVLLRVAGLALVIAYAAHLGKRFVARGDRLRLREAMPVALPLGALALWLVLRPLQGGDLYARNLDAFAVDWLQHPAAKLHEALTTMAGGWVSLFAVDSQVPLAVALVVIAFGALCLAGTLLRLRENRLDGWYAAIGLAMLVPIFFGEQVARRYLHPLVPVLLIHAVLALRALADRWPRARQALALVALPPALVAISSLALLAPRALDRAPMLEGFAIRHSDMMETFTARDPARARYDAAKNASVLAGFEAIRLATPKNARVMWMRPEYVSVLAERPAAPWYYAWDARSLARAIDAGAIDYVVVAGLLKSDLTGARYGNQQSIEGAVGSYAQVVVEIPNAVDGRPEFRLLKVDRAALRAYLQAT